MIRLSVDTEVDAAYLSLQSRDVGQPSVATTVPVDADINLDFDGEGRLIGIEVLSASKRLRQEVLGDATS